VKLVSEEMIPISVHYRVSFAKIVNTSDSNLNGLLRKGVKQVIEAMDTGA